MFQKFALLFFLSVSTYSYSYSGKVDTWAIYFNDSAVNSFNSNSLKIDVVLDLSLITSNDSLKIIFKSDQPCFNCEYYYFVSDDLHRKIEIIRKRVLHQSVTFSLENLLIEQRKRGLNNYLFQMVYTDYNTMKRSGLKLLNLQFE